MRIGDKDICRADTGPADVYVIAEVGVNHDGCADRAMALIDAAADAGADAVKFQYFETDRLLSAASKLAAYQREAGERDPVAMLRRLELSIGDLAMCARRAHARGLHAIVSVFSVELVRAACGAGFDALKSASPDVVNKPLLLEMVRTGLPMIVSTGTATAGEVVRTRGWLSDASERAAYLHCVSAYPTPTHEANIGACKVLAEIVSPCAVGYSDHTETIDAGAAAVSVGASILEKHLTYDRGAAGPDHAASLDPAGFAAYVACARTVGSPFDPALLGDGGKRSRSIEGDVKLASRQSVVTTRAIGAGETITREMLTIKRPGTGVPACEFEAVVGARALADVPCDVPVPPEAVALRSSPGGVSAAV